VRPRLLSQDILDNAGIISHIIARVKKNPRKNQNYLTKFNFRSIMLSKICDNTGLFLSAAKHSNRKKINLIKKQKIYILQSLLYGTLPKKI